MTDCPTFLDVAGDDVERIEHLLEREPLPHDPAELCVVLAGAGGQR